MNAEWEQDAPLKKKPAVPQGQHHVGHQSLFQPQAQGCGTAVAALAVAVVFFTAIASREPEAIPRQFSLSASLAPLVHQGTPCLLLALALAFAVWRAASACVRLHPASLEEEYAASLEAGAFLQRYDAFFLFVCMASNWTHGNKLAAYKPPQGAGATPPLGHLSLQRATRTYAVLAGLQLLVLLALPRLYMRRRGFMSLMGRVLRMLVFAHGSYCVLQQPAEWRPTFDADVMTMARRHPSFVVLRLLLIFSGALHLTLHHIMTLLPTRHAGAAQLLGVLAGPLQLLPPIVAAVQSDPDVKAAGDALCLAIHHVFDAVAWLPFPKGCSAHGLEMLMLFSCILLGCVLPLVITASLEHSTKKRFLQRRLQQRKPGDNAWTHARLQVQARLGSPAAWWWAATLGHLLLVIGGVMICVMLQLMMFEQDPAGATTAGVASSGAAGTAAAMADAAAAAIGSAAALT